MSPTTRLFCIVSGVILLGCSTGELYLSEYDPVLYEASYSSGEYRARGESIIVVDGEDARRAYPNIENFLDGPDPALALYREPLTRERVVDFFVAQAGSEAIALPILYYADRLNISLTLVYSLVWGESRFYPIAVNYNSASIDRGLFQLNSLTFRHLSEEDFFNPEVNTYHGLKYLEFCLQQGENDAQALAIYNAGLTRVIRGQTPASTLRYVDGILSYRSRLTARFRAYILSHFPPTIA